MGSGVLKTVTEKIFGRRHPGSGLDSGKCEIRRGGTLLPIEGATEDWTERKVRGGKGWDLGTATLEQVIKKKAMVARALSEERKKKRTGNYLHHSAKFADKGGDLS